MENRRRLRAESAASCHFCYPWATTQHAWVTCGRLYDGTAYLRMGDLWATHGSMGDPPANHGRPMAQHHYPWATHGPVLQSHGWTMGEHYKPMINPRTNYGLALSSQGWPIDDPWGKTHGPVYKPICDPSVQHCKHNGDTWETHRPAIKTHKMAHGQQIIRSLSRSVDGPWSSHRQALQANGGSMGGPWASATKVR